MSVQFTSCHQQGDGLCYGHIIKLNQEIKNQPPSKHTCECTDGFDVLWEIWKSFVLSVHQRDQGLKVSGDEAILKAGLIIAISYIAILNLDNASK